jgi:hypothetical protein
MGVFQGLRLCSLGILSSVGCWAGFPHHTKGNGLAESSRSEALAAERRRDRLRRPQAAVFGFPRGLCLDFGGELSLSAVRSGGKEAVGLRHCLRGEKPAPRSELRPAGNCAQAGNDRPALPRAAAGHGSLRSPADAKSRHRAAKSRHPAQSMRD